jgi:hypothetical protein
MAIPEELGHGNSKCADCDSDLPLKVLHSAAGYYIGTFCDNCGPYSRESDYYKSREEAQRQLDSGVFGR